MTAMVVMQPKKMNVPKLEDLMNGEVAVATAKLFNWDVSDMFIEGRRGTYPVTAPTDTDTLGPHAEREYLGGDDPGNRTCSVSFAGHDSTYSLTPGVRKVHHEDPDEDHGNPTASFVVYPVSTVAANDSGNNEVAGGHSNATGDENALSSEFVDP